MNEHDFVTNEWGTKINFEAAVNIMDDDIRRRLADEWAFCTKQNFFDEYCKAHLEKYGEEWELAKRNPCW